MKRGAPQPTDTPAVEKFAQGAADSGHQEADPNAPPNHKALAVRFNEYEWNLLEQGCQLTGSSKLNLVRKAVIEYVAARQRPIAMQRKLGEFP